LLSANDKENHFKDSYSAVFSAQDRLCFTKGVNPLQLDLPVVVFSLATQIKSRLAAVTTIAKQSS
jgi:hypothetical protein